MGKTSPITRYKSKLMSSIINSPELIALVNDSYIEDGEIIDANGLVYKQIFPFYYIPDTQTEALAKLSLKSGSTEIMR